MIDFEHVSKQYKHNAKPALEDVNFHVDDGEFVFLLGHSGAGKSTLLKLILREETPHRGPRAGERAGCCPPAPPQDPPTCAVRWASSFRISGSSPP